MNEERTLNDPETRPETPEAVETPTADAGDPPAAGAPGDAADDPADALRRERDELQERLLRLAAEFDNYRKRMERDRRDFADHTTADVMASLLPIIDNFERALQAPAGVEDDSFRKGVEMIHQQMLELLRKHDVKPIEALGADFDPNFHQAVFHEPSDAHREGEVMEELQRGYTLRKRLVRPAMVKVAKGS